MNYSNETFIISKNLGSNTKLYRYLSLSCFLEFVETKTTYLSNLNAWEDIWELPAKHKMPIEFSNNLYGQCWSLEGISDALWKIYAKGKEGILIQSSVNKFLSIDQIDVAMLSPVIYYDNLERALQKLDTLKGPEKTFYHGLLKRKAFQHEKEVRLITYVKPDKIDSIPKSISITLNPFDFIENIFIDPRASKWYVKTIQSYCSHVGFSITPQQSDLL